LTLLFATDSSPFMQVAPRLSQRHF